MALQIQKVGLIVDQMKRSAGARRQENMLNSLSEAESYSSSSVTSSASSCASASEDSIGEKETSVKENAAHVYSELTTIRDKLHEELQRIKERENQLAEREKAVLELGQLAQAAHERLTQFAEEEVTRRWRELEERMQKESQQLSDTLKEKCRENKRLHNSFDSVKHANNSLRKQLEAVQQRNQKLEMEISSVQARLTNLQRKQELQSAKQAAVTINTAIHNAKLTTSPAKPKDHRRIGKFPLADEQCFELLAVLLGWLCDDQLCRAGSPTHLATSNCTKVLPIIATLIPSLHSTSTQTQLPVLKFVYLSILHLNTITKQKSSLTTTLRRIGEELQKPCTTGSSCKAEQLPFFQSSDLHIRLLSSLIILQTISQVDYLAIIFDVIKQDLKDDIGKETFLLYHGVSAILCFLKPTHKILCEHTADIFLLLSMESVTLQLFLSECSNDEWFGACVNLFREAKNVGIKVLEKMSIVLQRLSKVKSNRKRFEQSHLIPVIQKLSGTLNDSDTAFLTLNLRSVILNLNK